jgi:alpha-L-fucosidase
VTINDSWGYQVQDHNHKSVRQLVRMFAETIGMGGNMLLDLGPYEDGSFQPEQVARLEGLGDWIRKHETAIFATERGLPPGHFYGASTLSKDKKSLYLFTFDRPFDQLAVKGIRNPVVSATVVGSDAALSYRKIGGADWEGIPGVLWIDVPGDQVDERATVIRLDFAEPLDLYVGKGRS